MIVKEKFGIIVNRNGFCLYFKEEISLAFVITSPCKDEKAGECMEVCPVDCIEEGKDMFYIDPDICIDCGACEAVCPVEAIFMEDEVPEEENEYIALNKKFFEER